MPGCLEILFDEVNTTSGGIKHLRANKEFPAGEVACESAWGRRFATLAEWIKNGQGI